MRADRRSTRNSHKQEVEEIQRIWQTHSLGVQSPQLVEASIHTFRNLTIHMTDKHTCHHPEQQQKQTQDVTLTVQTKNKASKIQEKKMFHI